MEAPPQVARLETPGRLPLGPRAAGPLGGVPPLPMPSPGQLMYYTSSRGAKKYQLCAVAKAGRTGDATIEIPPQSKFFKMVRRSSLCGVTDGGAADGQPQSIKQEGGVGVMDSGASAKSETGLESARKPQRSPAVHTRGAMVYYRLQPANSAVLARVTAVSTRLVGGIEEPLYALLVHSDPSGGVVMATPSQVSHAVVPTKLGRSRSGTVVVASPSSSPRIGGAVASPLSVAAAASNGASLSPPHALRRQW